MWAGTIRRTLRQRTEYSTEDHIIDQKKTAERVGFPQSTVRAQIPMRSRSSYWIAAEATKCTPGYCGYILRPNVGIEFAGPGFGDVPAQFQGGLWPYIDHFPRVLFCALSVPLSFLCAAYILQ
jgi:hypothetical protein